MVRRFFGERLKSKIVAKLAADFADLLFSSFLIKKMYHIIRIFEYIYIRAKNRADSVKVEGRNQNQQMLIEKKIEHTCKSSRE